MLSLSIFDQGPPQPCLAPFNMAAYVLAGGEKTPDKVALEIISPDGCEIWTYGALKGAVLATATGLAATGLKPGDLILLRIGNEVSFPILFLAAIAAGFVPVPTSSQLTEPEIRSLITDLDPALVIFGHGISRLSVPCASLGPDEILAFRNHPPFVPVMGDPNRLAYIITTSGTSGRPKAVEHAHRAVWARRMMWDGWYGLRQNDRLLHAGAFNWTYTLGTGLMDPWAIGATALIPHPKVAASALLDEIAAHKVTIFAAAPGVYRQMLKTAETPGMPDLRHGLSAGEKLPDSLRQAWTARTGTGIYEALGMSEVSTFISTAPGMRLPSAATGRPQKGRRIAVLSPTDFQPVATDQPGILAVGRADPGLMLGYRRSPGETAEKFTGDWFLTGDTVSMDGAGNVTYLGREDDMMNAGGYRVSPIEVETVLNAHPDIHESAAVSVEIKPDTFVIAAFYQSDSDLDETVLATYCAARLARYKCPRLFRRLASLPKGANNKLRRGDLRRDFRRQHDQN